MQRTADAPNRLKRARHREIAQRYKRERPAFSMAALRCAEINRLLESRYGTTLPDDDAGRDDIRIMAHHLERLSGDPRKRIGKWLDTHAPWLIGRERTALIGEVTDKPRRWRADKLAGLLNLHEAERHALRITTIGAIDMTKTERAKRREERKRSAKKAGRKRQSRGEYEAASITRAQPWKALGISRATWYRRTAKPTVRQV